jgi:SWI/SNF-related matrix-associated actin-dependent regulator 1 of chromatin subfamily A
MNNVAAKPMVITAKYVSICKSCGRQVEPGDRVEWVRGDKFVSHVQCTEGGRAHVAAVAASRSDTPKADAPEIPCPEGMSFFPYQVAGIQRAISLDEGVLIADEQGLGKCAETVGYVNASPMVTSVLIVCPASVRINWEREWLMWTTREMAVGQFDAKSPDLPAVTIINFDILDKLLSMFPHTHWDLLVVDEVHFAKNPKAKRTQNILELKKRSALVIGLTGTPIPNKPIELFPILQLVAPEAWDPPGTAMKKVDGKKSYVPVGAGGGAGFFRFAKRYAGAHQEWVSKTKQVWMFDGASNLDELNEKLRTTCMVRRLKVDVLKDLPPKRRNIVCFPRDGWEDEITGECKGLAVVLKETTLEGAAKALTKCKIEFTDYSRVRHSTAMAKVDLVAEHVIAALEGGSEKVIVFAHHHDVIDRLNVLLAPYGCVQVTGESPQYGEGSRQECVDSFQKNPATRVFIGSIGAAGVGITLTASSHVVFAELPLRPADMVQAEDRAHRIGQKGSVLIDVLVFDGSVDAHIAKMLVAKQDVADMALDDETGLNVDLSGRPQAPTTTLSYVAAREKAFKDAGLTLEECAALLAKMRYLAGQCDGAVQQDGHGFSKFDAGIGHALAECKSLSPKQALCARKLATKYRRQLEGRTF